MIPLVIDNLALRGWPHDPICKLCRIHPETVQHLLLECSFATAVREQVFAWNGTIGRPPTDTSLGINSWWEEAIRTIPKEKRREASGAFIYSMWGTWKERNRRTFRNTALLPVQVALLVREEIAQRAYAHSQDPGDVPAV